MSKPRNLQLDAPSSLYFPEGTDPLQAAEEHGVVIKGLKIGTAGTDPVTTDQVMQDAVRQMMGDVADPHFQRTVEETLQEMASGAGNSGVGGVDASDPLSDGNIAASVFSSLATHSGAAGAQTIAQTMAMLSKLGEGINEPGGVKADGTLPGSDAAQSTESLSDELIRNMMGEYEAMGKKADFENITDNMMRQLLSKDIMCVGWEWGGCFLPLLFLYPYPLLLPPFLFCFTFSPHLTSAPTCFSFPSLGTSPCEPSLSASPLGWQCTQRSCPGRSTRTMGECT
jgi:hypothetical protein